MALELYCLVSASDRVSRNTVSGCSAVCLGALLHPRALLSVSAILIGGHHVSVHVEATFVLNTCQKPTFARCGHVTWGTEGHLLCYGHLLSATGTEGQC